MKHTTTLSLTEPKKHSVRYDNPKSESFLNTIYVNKRAFPLDRWPESITITVEWKE